MQVILWTDALIYILLMLLLLSLYFAVVNPNIRATWRKVFQRPSRIIALMILIVFAVIGLLDSIHYLPKKAEQTASLSSVLDYILQPISAETEKSYSAPFATHLFIPDLQKNAQGEVSWVAEPLKYVTPVPITSCLVAGSWLIVAIWSVVTLLIYFNKKLKAKLHSPQFVTGWITLLIILCIIGSCGVLMQHYHILGTDKIGEDVFYSSLKSIRTGLVIGTLATMLTLPFAIILGAMAGYFRGWVDDLIQYIYTTLSSIPGVLLIAAAMLSLDAVIDRHSDAFSLMAQRADARLLLLCTILGVTSWTTLCRILRGETLKLREQEFILAARVMGSNSMQIIIKHIVPNLMHIILISVILDFSGLVLAEAVLSYVGVGVDSSMFSWGNMINGARTEMGRDPVIWWSLFGAFIMMFTLVLAANIFSDGVRDAFDPKAA